ncbi:hypothetical protein [Nocardioides sp. MH1]|uniref:hypothetical protein n=1 Tax=Nocardioides sp. MH1 TaxID=3242490 RepID=UPI00351FB3F3
MIRPAARAALALAVPVLTVAALGAPASAAAPVVYHGQGATVHRASGQVDHRLAETPRAFRSFVRTRLDQIWGWTDNDPACAQAPLVVVKEVRSKVAYISDEGSFPGGPGGAPDSCATGGNYHFFVKRDGAWKAPRALGGQDVMSCRTFRRWDIPRMSGAHQCWDGEDVVRWDG